MIAAIEACGSVQALAIRLGKLRQAVQRWKRVPAEMVVTVEQVTGVPRERLRPDLYRVQDKPDTFEVRTVPRS
jgi:DNA-binding transcriptional regulator YdaS (Cro superfamily)